ncbi:MAG: Dyp-type peroxidase [Nitrospira sp.]|nr:Dyp-type peroxidase [Nitrospira sp.]
MSPEQPLLDLQDVQGNILSKYDAGYATYLFYRVDLVEQALQWLDALLEFITTEKRKVHERPQSMVNIAVTFQGFRALGLSPTSLDSFPPEFQQGMKNRAGVLCDFGGSAPENWERPLGSPQVHILAIIHGADRTHCDDLEKKAHDQIERTTGFPAGVTLLARMEADGLPGNKEHFGFKDGISQPWIEGTNPGPPIEPYGGKRIKPSRADANLADSFAPLKLGEFLLGYKDELDRINQPLIPPELGTNGTYLVLRKLHQDVAKFHAQMKEEAKFVFGDTAAKDRLAALMVGRWPSGCPVDRSWERDDPAFTTDETINAFAFVDENTGTVDDKGIHCPVGAHIRRTNPRDLKLDTHGNLILESMSTRHRMIRRSLPYGRPIQTKDDETEDRGLVFIALVSDIERQFEFVQRNWVNDGDPFRLDRTDRDPLLGNNRDQRDVTPSHAPQTYSDILTRMCLAGGIAGAVTAVVRNPTTIEITYKPSSGIKLDRTAGFPEKLALSLQVEKVEITPHPDGVSAIVTIFSFNETARKFTVPAGTRRPWALNLPEFVTTRGGEYFFLPSLTALKSLVQGDLSSFRREFELISTRYRDPAKRSEEQGQMIRSWLVYRPKEMLQELREMADGPQGTIFTMDGYKVFGNPIYTANPPIAVITKYADVVEVLDGRRHPEFSVALYRKQMDLPPGHPPRGPFILGRELSDPLYQREMPILAKAVQDSPVTHQLGQIITAILDPIFNDLKQRKSGKIDVIQDLAWPIPLGINARYFGVPGPDPESFKRWLRDIYRDLFLNLRGIPEWSQAADRAAAEMNPYLDGLIQEYDMRTESVLKQLILEEQKAQPAFAPHFVRRNIMGLTVGVVETTLKAVARTIDQLIRRPRQLKEAQEAARLNDKALVLRYTFEAMRFNPQNHLLFRMCTSDTEIAVGTPRQTTIKKGTVVFAATLPAMFDAEGPFKQPNEFRTDRNQRDYLFFGYDGHECMGRCLIPVVFQELFTRLLQLKDLRRAIDDPFDPIDLFPKHFYLEFQA